VGKGGGSCGALAGTSGGGAGGARGGAGGAGGGEGGGKRGWKTGGAEGGKQPWRWKKTLVASAIVLWCATAMKPTPSTTLTPVQTGLDRQYAATRASSWNVKSSWPMPRRPV
jgi:hypothetical protein